MFGEPSIPSPVENVPYEITYYTASREVAINILPVQKTHELDRIFIDVNSYPIVAEANTIEGILSTHFD